MKKVNTLVISFDYIDQYKHDNNFLKEKKSFVKTKTKYAIFIVEDIDGKTVALLTE